MGLLPNNSFWIGKGPLHAVNETALKNSVTLELFRAKFKVTSVLLTNDDEVRVSERCQLPGGVALLAV